MKRRDRGPGWYRQRSLLSSTHRFSGRLSRAPFMNIATEEKEPETGEVI